MSKTKEGIVTAFLFVTDLDNTLVGDDASLVQLNQQLEQCRQEYGTKIVYATGRSLFLYRQLAEEKQLLSPDALVTAVGTEIYFNAEQDIYDLEWADILSEGWDRQEVSAIASHYYDLVLQPPSEQNPFKVSYYLTEKAAGEVLPRLQLALQEHGLSAKLVYSGSKDLDILPEKGDKGLAIKYLRNKWQINAKKTVVCGDSGNDIALLSGEEMGIIVGNARPELVEWYEANATNYRYYANATYASGIIEGLKQFGFLT
jgi:hypothetical protein